jgi:hypothetical protein
LPLAGAGRDLPLPKPFKERDLGLETAWNLANVGSAQFDAAIAFGRVLGSSTGGVGSPMPDPHHSW